MLPGYENCYIISSTSLVGIRETRHFKGMYTLTEDDILSARVFDDYVVRDAHFNFDVHNMTGSGLDATGCTKALHRIAATQSPTDALSPKMRKSYPLRQKYFRERTWRTQFQSNADMRRYRRGGRCCGAIAACKIHHAARGLAEDIRKLIF